MKLKNVLASMLMSYCAASNAQLSKIWDKPLKSSHSDELLEVSPEHDGYVVACRRQNSADFDPVLKKTDLRGNQVWERSYGTRLDYLFDMAKTEDGYVLVGDSRVTPSGAVQALVIRTDNDGNLFWERKIGEVDNRAAQGVAVVEDGYIITGTAVNQNNDMWLAKLDKTGQLVWETSAGGEGYDFGRHVIAGNDAYYVAGNSMSFGHGYQPIWFVKFNLQGEELTSNFFADLDRMTPNVLQQTPDGKFLIAGETYKMNTSDYNDAYLVKTRPDLYPEWEKTYGTPGREEIFSLIQENGVLAVGHTSENPNGPYTGWILKTDENGTEQWEQKLPEENTRLKSINKIPGGYLLGGVYLYNNGTMTTQTPFLMKFGVTGVKNIEDYLLGKTNDAANLDINQDGKIDVADLTMLLR